MGKFGQTLFGGSGFIRWALSPFVVLFAVLMPLCVGDWTLGGVLMMTGMELMCFCLLAGFWLPMRFGFIAFRVLSGLVFLAYVAYLIAELFFRKKAVTLTGQRSDASPLNALLGLVIIGGPSLLFAVLGRFSIRRPPEPTPDGDIVDSTHDDT